MTSIARRAGVTWGAIQHQFREKDPIFDAVMEASLAELELHFEWLAVTEPHLDARVRGFVRGAGELVRGPSYRAFVEIQLNRARDPQRDPAAEKRWARKVAQSLARAWRHAFGGLGIPSAKLLTGQRFAFMVLSGIATEAMLFPAIDFSRQHLRELESGLLRIYSNG
jgi:AcrR family transcriptional regulator